MMADSTTSTRCATAVGGVALVGLTAWSTWRWLKNRAVLRSVSIAERPVGFYAGYGGETYYRRELGAPVYRVEPEAVEATQLLRPGATPSIKYRFVRETPTLEPSSTRDESLLATSEPPRFSVQTPGFVVALAVVAGDNSAVVVGGGFRVGEWLITARHVFEQEGMVGYGASKILILAKGKQAEATLPHRVGSSCTSDFLVPPAPNSGYSRTWRDVAAYRVGNRPFLALGVKSAKYSDFTVYPEATVQTFGAPDGRMMTSTGVVCSHDNLEAKSGVFAHTCSTVQGWSGSPVVTMVNGSPKILGMHVSGGAKANYAITSCALEQFFKGVVQHHNVSVLDIPSCLKHSALYTLFSQAVGNEGRMYNGKKRLQELDDSWSQRSGSAGYSEDYERVWGQQGGQHGDWWSDDEGKKNPPDAKALAGFMIAFEAFVKNERNQDHIWYDEDSDICWVRRQVTWGMHSSARKCLTHLIETGLMTSCNSCGESWVAFATRPIRPPSKRVEEASPSTSGAAGFPDPRPAASVNPPPGLTAEQWPSAPLAVSTTASQFEPDPLPQAETKKTFVPDETAKPQSKPKADGWCNLPTDWATPFDMDGPLPWAQTVADCKEPLPAKTLHFGPNITRTSEEGDVIAETQGIDRAMHEWFTHGDVASLRAVKGVGAATLLALPAFSEFRAYITAGKTTLWKDYNGEPRNTVKNQRGEVHAFRIGTCPPSFGQDKEGHGINPDFLQACAGLELSGKKKKKLDELLSGYVMPPSGPKAVRDSFKVQCARQSPGNWERLRATPNFHSRLREFCAAYPAIEVPLVYKSFVEAVDLYASTCDPTKSAGWSARYMPGPKGTWTGTSEKRELLAYLVACRLALRMAEGDNIHYLSPRSMLELGLRDPEEAFVKMEAHDPKKAAAGRWRLIWIASMVDGVAQDVVHRPQNKADIATYLSGDLHEQCIGMGHHDEGLSRLGKTFDRMTQHDTKPLRYSDASGWDLSVCRDAIYFDTQRRVSRLADAAWDARQAVKDLLWAEAATNTTHIIVFGREMWTFTHFGVTATGIPSTSAQNSPIRSFTLVACGADAAVAAGDDETHTGEVDYDLLASTGVIIKEGSDGECGPTGPVAMTSHLYTRKGGHWSATFDNFPKMLAHLGLKHAGAEPPSQDCLGGLRFALRHTPEYEEILLTVCARMGWHVPAALYHEGIEL